MNLALRLLDRQVDGGALADQGRPPAASDTTPRAEGASPTGRRDFSRPRPIVELFADVVRFPGRLPERFWTLAAPPPQSQRIGKH